MVEAGSGRARPRAGGLVIRERVLAVRGAGKKLMPGGAGALALASAEELVTGPAEELVTGPAGELVTGPAGELVTGPAGVPAARGSLPAGRGARRGGDAPPLWPAETRWALVSESPWVAAPGRRARPPS